MRKRAGAVTDRCRRLKWGDTKGHAERGESYCAVCTEKHAVRFKLYRLQSGRSARLSKADLFAFVREFNRAWDALGHDPERVFKHAAEAMLNGI